MEGQHCNPDIECRLRDTPRGCFEDTHHEYWPKRDYTSELDKEFRELSVHKKLGCRALHNELHATTEPPEKPRPIVMREAVNRARIQELLNGEAAI